MPQPSELCRSASNRVASNGARASNATASNAVTEGDRNGDRKGGVGVEVGWFESVQGSGEAVAQVGAGSEAGIQRDVQRDGGESGVISASSSGQAERAHVAHDGVECGVGGGGRGVKQRWSRESYNAYQREYMRRRRALASGD